MRQSPVLTRNPQYKTGNDVRQTLISTTWLREGYSIDEVDELLDDVAASIDAIADANIVIQPVKTTHKLRRRSPFSRKKRGGR